MKACIVGGGTAGWITLCYLAATTDLELTLIHSEEIEIIGVGESTTPALRYVANKCGIDEKQFMKGGKGTYKYAVHFENWLRPGSHWKHSFDDTQIMPDELTSIEYFLKAREMYPNLNVENFNMAHGPYEYLIKNKLSIYNSDGIDNVSPLQGPAYHINAYDFGQTLRKNTDKNKFTEITKTVEKINYDEKGIKSLILADGTEIQSDIFFDCTGFHRLLSKNLTTFEPYNDLKNDRAIFGEVKNLTLDHPATGAIAQNSGWIWNIPTWKRVGSGHVYSSAYCSDQEAENTIINYWKVRGQEWSPLKHVKFQSGKLKNIAIKNMITNGLGQSFIEPLEATSIMITCVTAIEFAKQYNKHHTWNEKSSQILDTVISRMIKDTKEHVRYHYELSDRTDTDYWMDYKNKNAVQEVSDWIDKTLKKPTFMNGFNWASMLIGYEKPYMNKTRNIEINSYLENILNRYKTYEKIYSKNIPLIKRFQEIHLS